jgi:hypothetical protein
MPTIHSTPISGKWGYVSIATYLVPFGRWSANIQAEYLESNNFNRWPFGIEGIEGGEVTFGGDVNAQAAAFFSYAGPPLSLRIGQRPVVTLGFSPTLFLPPVEILILGYVPGVDVNGKGTLEYRGQVQGSTTPTQIPWYPGGPYTLTAPTG